MGKVIFIFSISSFVIGISVGISVGNILDGIKIQARDKIIETDQEIIKSMQTQIDLQDSTIKIQKKTIEILWAK